MTEYVKIIKWYCDRLPIDMTGNNIPPIIQAISTMPETYELISDGKYDRMRAKLKTAFQVRRYPYVMMTNNPKLVQALLRIKKTPKNEYGYIFNDIQYLFNYVAWHVDRHGDMTIDNYKDAFLCRTFDYKKAIRINQIQYWKIINALRFAKPAQMAAMLRKDAKGKTIITKPIVN